MVIPLSKPMLAALGLFTAVGHWNDWFAGAFFVTDHRSSPFRRSCSNCYRPPTFPPCSVRHEPGSDRQKRSDEKHYAHVDQMAVVMVSAIPILCIYPFLQKYFVKGVLIGSVKG